METVVMNRPRKIAKVVLQFNREVAAYVFADIRRQRAEMNSRVEYWQRPENDRRKAY
ncbi:MAG: hypothetical protein RBT11_19640 [Desulfobacterales bacterium]|jgi:hypothetical protein|nr:hypothetical protein [Desulfobacterales bacterium]